LHRDRIPSPKTDDPGVARILIVEPHPDIRSLLEHVVKRLGHETVYHDGNGGPMPEVDAAVIEPGDFAGLRLARLVREQGRPVVFTSIFPADREALELTPAAYFVKPFALNELEGALAAALAAPVPP
jgi:CheY-like chemotaxis protein